MLSPERGPVRALFADPAQAESARRELLLAGFHEREIEVGEPKRGLLDTLMGHEEPRGTLVSVDAAGRGLEAASLLYRHGGRDPEAGAEEPRPEAEGAVPAEGGQHLDLVAEELVPSLVAVQVGEVRLRKRVVAEQRTIEVTVRHEEVSVEGLPQPQRPLAVEAGEEEALPPAEAAAAGTLELADEEEVIRIPVLAEQVVIHRRPFISEEVVIRKRRVPESQEVQGQVRREELEIEAQGATVETEGGEAVVRPTGPAGGESPPPRPARPRSRTERQERR